MSPPTTTPPPDRRALAGLFAADPATARRFDGPVPAWEQPPHDRPPAADPAAVLADLCATTRAELAARRRRLGPVAPGDRRLAHLGRRLATLRASAAKARRPSR
ncbi:hypothetical protein [Roseospirillum parvum]|uniref:Uncharacterized protein n=1 Tax=Roseospirillum parvum TaxID=83401 RepID=A0A1G7W7Z9_9PROT|nr:hypothetical protein [Roseospirillum parvum]SDG68043.1 hypothetical protein SAMN05421742_102107 [Roseospirillum parvum]